MLRVSTPYADTSASTAAYYTRYLTQADDEQPGRWTGRQAALLGLSGEVTTEDLQALLEGRDPNSGTPLGSPFVNRVTSSGRVVRAVAGFDATLSAPKSLSVWWALTGDEGLAACHDVAVRAVVDCVERFGSTTRVRSNGARLHPESQGLTVAMFRQTTSRLDDPQLHSHDRASPDGTSGTDIAQGDTRLSLRGTRTAGSTVANVKCVFCLAGSRTTKISKEHLFSKPICSALGIDRTKVIASLDGNTGEVSRPLRLDQRLVKLPCVDCNSGWMEQLERDTARTLRRWL